jgi:phosphate transport system substrate-binding protein
VNPPASAKDAYPISGLTYLLVPKQPANAARGENVKKFLQYVLTQGQNEAVQLHYAKLPQSLIDSNQKMLSGGM